MGNYQKHQAETGTYLCSSYEQVKKFGRAGEETDTAKLELELQRFEFYSQRYINHQNSVKFGREKLEKIKEQITHLCKTQFRYGYKDY